MSSTKFHPNPLTLVRVTNDFQLKERKSTFEIPADSKSTYIPLSRYQNAIPLRLSSFSQDSITTHSPCIPPNLIKIHCHSSKLQAISNSKSTYIPLSRYQIAIPLRFSSFLQGSINTHSPHTPPNHSLIHHHSSELHTFLCSPQKHEFFDPLRLSSFSQGSTCTHSPCSPQNFIQIQRRTPELHSTPTQRALIYL